VLFFCACNKKVEGLNGYFNLSKFLSVHQLFSFGFDLSSRRPKALLATEEWGAFWRAFTQISFCTLVLSN
jgi:hypothetical protein